MIAAMYAYVQDDFQDFENASSKLFSRVSWKPYFDNPLATSFSLGLSYLLINIIAAGAASVENGS